MIDETKGWRGDGVVGPKRSRNVLNNRTRMLSYVLVNLGELGCSDGFVSFHSSINNKFLAKGDLPVSVVSNYRNAGSLGT